MAALAYNTTTVFAILPINFLTGLVIPYTRALLSNSVLPAAQAEMFAGLSGIESIGTLMSPLFSLGYSFTVSTYGESMFLVMSALTGVSALIMLHIRSRQLILSEQYSTVSNLEIDDMKEPILGAQTTTANRHVSTGAYPRTNSIISNATTFEDRQISLSVAF